MICGFICYKSYFCRFSVNVMWNKLLYSLKIVLQVKMFRMAFSFTGMNLYRTKTLEQLFSLFIFCTCNTCCFADLCNTYCICFAVHDGTWWKWQSLWPISTGIAYMLQYSRYFFLHSSIYDNFSLFSSYSHYLKSLFLIAAIIFGHLL